MSILWDYQNQGGDQVFADDLEEFKRDPTSAQFYSLALALPSTTKIEFYALQLYQIAKKNKFFKGSVEGAKSREWYVNFCKDRGFDVHPQSSKINLVRKALKYIVCK